MSDDDFSVTAARRAAERDELAEWVARFLASPGSGNAPLAHKLTSRLRWWSGPFALPLDKLGRLAGPPGAPVLETVEEDEWRDDVDDLASAVADGFEPPPVVVTQQDGQLVVEDGNHRIEALRRAGRTRAWGVVGFEDADDRDRFVPPGA